MIPIASRKRESEQEVPSDAANEQIAHNALDLDCAEGESGVRNPEEGGDRGTVPERPSAVVSEYTRDDDQVGEGARHAIRSERSEGECLCRDGISSVNIYQIQRETPRIQHLVLPSLLLMQQRSP